MKLTKNVILGNLFGMGIAYFGVGAARIFTLEVTKNSFIVVAGKVI